MYRHEILPVLYDLAITIGSEIRLKPLLTRTLQRLLYHTSFSAGFVCLDVPFCKEGRGEIEVQFDAAVGDFDLISLVGHRVKLPCELICHHSGHESGQMELLSALPCTQSEYKAYLRLPLGESGLIVLLANEIPPTELPLKTMLEPVLAHFAKAILLCRNNDRQQEQIEQSLLQSELNFNALVELSPIGVGFSSDGTIMNANQVFVRMFGYERLEEVANRALLDLIAPGSRAEVEARIRRRAAGEAVETTYETMGLRKDGSEFPMLVSAKRAELPMGPRTFSFFVDLTAQKHNESELRASNEMLHAVIENAPIRVFWKDRESRYLGCNATFAKDAGLSGAQALVGKTDFEMGWHAQAEQYRADDRRLMESNQPKLNFEEPQSTPDGKKIWLRTSKVPLHDAVGKVIGVLGIYDDITEQKMAEAQIHQLAFYDALTGLPNRRLLLDRLQQAFSVSARNGQHGAVLFLDLDNFKTLNDSKGHDFGDQLLKQVAERLVSCIRDGDTVARLGGDEFVVVLESLSSNAEEAVTQADMVAEKVRAELGLPYQFGDYLHYSTPSIGVVLFRGHLQPLEDVLRFADTAMYQAKQAGRNVVRFYDPAMQAAIETRAQLEEELRSALDKKQLQVYYQIQVDSRGDVLGAEALLRWQHPVRGLVSPGAFIPLAEETGLIVPIGQWVLQEACRQLHAWQADSQTRDLSLSVNVSAKQFRRPDFVSMVERTLLDFAVKPKLLKLELTESIVVENVEDTIAKMRELKIAGVHFSMDDFGTGYSSLQYLKRLPLDQIKIDQSFVRDITSDPNDAAIVQTIIAMSEMLGLDVIAEGVETQAQFEFLELRGCHAFQGYLFGKPQPIVELEQRLHQH